MDGKKLLTVSSARDSTRTKIAANGPLAKKPTAQPETTTPEPQLRLRSRRQAKDGNGLFQTFAPSGKKAEREALCTSLAPACSDTNYFAVSEGPGVVDPWLIPREPTNETTSRLMRWTNMTNSFRESYSVKYVLGEWMELVPQRLGNSQSIDTALECFLSSIVTCVNRGPDNLAVTDKWNAKALRSIRADILSGDQELISNDVLIAICMLTFVEVGRASNMPPGTYA